MVDDCNLKRTRPWLNPDWRWQRAYQIVVQGGYSTRHRDGELIQRTVRCIRQLERSLTERGVRRAAMDYPDIYWALRLQQESSTRVLELKARVLASQSDQMIASSLGLPSRTVTTFIALYFDVRSQLTATSWILRVAIGLPLNQEPSVESLLLLHAWKRGPMVIEPWLDFLKHQMERHDLSTDLGLQRAWIEQLVRVQQLPFEAQCLRSLCKLSPFILGKPPETIHETTVRTIILQNRARILEEITWNEPENESVEAYHIPFVRAEILQFSKERKIAQAG